MNNPAISWIKEHPALAGTLAAAVGLLVYLITRSGSGSSLASTVAASNAQNAALATQNAQVQAAAQVQTQTAAYAAQVENNKTGAALAATIAQYNAQQNVAKIAADVQTNQTNQQASVANNYINASSAANERQINAESLALQNELQYMRDANQTQADLAKAAIDRLVKGGSTLDYNTQVNAALALGTGQSGAVNPLLSGAAQIDYGYNAASASNIAAISRSISSIFSSLFS